MNNLHILFSGQTLTEAGYSKFMPGEPNNLEPGQSCGTIGRGGLLADIWCERPFLFICEKSPGYPIGCRPLPEYALDNKITP